MGNGGHDPGHDAFCSKLNSFGWKNNLSERERTGRSAHKRKKERERECIECGVSRGDGIGHGLISAPVCAGALPWSLCPCPHECAYQERMLIQVEEFRN